MAIDSVKYLNLVSRGFTLVELLVVMGVVGVLAAGLIALINPADRLKQANDAKVTADLNQMIKGVQLYSANNSGSYPVQGGAANWTTLGAALVSDSDLTVAPAVLTDTGRVYTANCAAAGPCKIAVSLVSGHNLGGSANAQACWLSTAGTVTYIKNAAAPTTNAACP